jgi:O-methyltransferase
LPTSIAPSPSRSTSYATSRATSPNSAYSLECWWLKFFGQRRNLHLFDSWEGYGEPAAQDLTSPEVVRGTWRRGPLPGQVPPEELQRRLERIYKGGRIITHKGFFAQTLPTIPPETKFALIVIDPGLYSAIDEVLTHLFSHRHVPEGAIILFNTYNASRASSRHSARAAWAKAVRQHEIEFSDEGTFHWSGRKFIVQSYRGMTSSP